MMLGVWGVGRGHGHDGPRTIAWGRRDFQQCCWQSLTVSVDTHKQSEPNGHEAWWETRPSEGWLIHPCQPRLEGYLQHYAFGLNLGLCPVWHFYWQLTKVAGSSNLQVIDRARKGQLILCMKESGFKMISTGWNTGLEPTRLNLTGINVESCT